MNVCLVIPPSAFLLDERVFPSLGVLKVAAALEQARVPVTVLDLSGVANEVTATERYLRQIDADVFGITATMPQLPAARRVAQTIRRDRPAARLILGGPHPTLVYSSARQEAQNGTVGRGTRMLQELHRFVDVVVAGDGEKAIVEALGADPPRLIDAEQPKSNLFLTKSDLTSAPFPARHLIDLASYHYAIDGEPATSLLAQLGCPFGCGFCGGRRSPFLRQVRTRSTPEVIREMRHLYDTYGTRGFMFFDDELNVNKQFPELLMAMIQLQQALGVAFRLRGFLKSELLTEAQVALMFEAGFRQVPIGFESGSDRMLTNMRKGATVAENTRCVEILHAYGIQVKALMSLGHPGESPETVTATRDWLLAVQPDDFDLTVITPYPGTPYFDEATRSADGTYTYRPKSGDALHMQDVDQLTDVAFYKGMPGSYQAFVWTDDLSRADVVASRDRVEAEVREGLGIAYPMVAAPVAHETTMGQA